MDTRLPLAPTRSRASLARRVDLLLWRVFGQGARLAVRGGQRGWLAGLASLWLTLTR
jgi:hypothetical protein